jgi:hypothetical protein
MLEAWERGEFGSNKSAAGRAYGFDRSDATKIINAHEDTPRPSPPPAAAAGSAEQAAGLVFSAILGLPEAVKLGEAGDLGR